ncbi:hypothetical protein AB0945_43650 [Streptomyces sp. NPDC005474]|uniref:hypothetical protein n=1 Tax=Streptomyces sp. NPDC005474 TaxID=3154878 RepID=UPI003451BC77
MQLLSTPSSPARRRTATSLTALRCVALPVLGAAAQPPAASAAAAEVVGNTTHFDGLGSPYGGCGLPQRELDSQDFVALNVFNTPGDHSGAYPRPVPDPRTSIKGLFDNGRNCGRWGKVTIGDDGARAGPSATTARGRPTSDTQRRRPKPGHVLLHSLLTCLSPRE